MRYAANKEFWLAALRQEGAAFRSVLSVDALGAPVPSCPTWTLGTLAGHLGGVYAWVRGHAGRGVTTRPERFAPRDVPEGAALIDWFDTEYSTLLGVLDRLDPHLPAWNWAPQRKTAEFWHRRMAHETAVHRWDAQVAVGLAEPIEVKLAVDGVHEVLDSWLPAGRRRGATDAVGVVHLVASDAEHDWYVRLRGEAVALLDTETLVPEEHHARAYAAGTASDLELALYGRIPFDVLDLAGDTHLLDGLRTG